MKRGVSIIAIGDEVLYGATANTNAACIAEALFQRGYVPVTHVVTSDAPEDIARVVGRELSAGRDVITTGGLGPTIDDNTKPVVAQLFSRPLVRNDALFQDLRLRFGEPFPTLEQQSLQPQGATIFQNTVGTASGILLEDEKLFPNARLFVLPGPPHEMKAVFFQEVLPHYFQQKRLVYRTVRCLGIAEHDIDLVLRSLQQQYPSLHIGIYPSYQLIRVAFSVADEADAPAVDHAINAVQAAFPEHLLTEPSLEAELSTILLDRGWKIATAESCTGGGLAARLTSVPGSSEVVAGGIVAYHNFVKEALLGVPSDVLDKYGSVSTEVTELMARGVEGLFGVQVVCAVSGYFGPTGGTPLAPVGTVCASFLTPNSLVSERFSFSGTRESICEKTIQTLLARLILML